MSHYHRSKRPMLLGDVAAEPQQVEQQESTPILDEPIVRTAATAAGVYHGYRRTQSIGWALFYGIAARWAPVIVGAVMIAQGYGAQKTKE